MVCSEWVSMHQHTRLWCYCAGYTVKQLSASASTSECRAHAVQHINLSGLTPNGWYCNPVQYLHKYSPCGTSMYILQPMHMRCTCCISCWPALTETSDSHPFSSTFLSSLVKLDAHCDGCEAVGGVVTISTWCVHETDTACVVETWAFFWIINQWYCLCMYLTGIHSCRLTCLQQVSLVISATSYYWFRGSTPFEIAYGSYGQQCNLYSFTWKYRRNRSGNVRRGARGKYSMNTL